VYDQESGELLVRDDSRMPWRAVKLYAALCYSKRGIDAEPLAEALLDPAGQVSLRGPGRCCKGFG